MSFGGWLRNLGLGRYESAFIENAIDFDVLPELTEGDLEKLGMPLGDRKRILKAIKTMAGGSPSARSPSEAGGVAKQLVPHGWCRTPGAVTSELCTF